MEETAQKNPFSADEFAAPVLAEVAAMDNETIGKEIVRMTGGGWWNVSVYQEAFERMTPERALGLYVLVQVLNDIEPLDEELSGQHFGGMPREAFRHAKQAHRIAHHQKVEQELRLEGLELKAVYRAHLRQLRRDGRCEVKTLRGCQPIRGGVFSGPKRGRKKLRDYYEAKWRRYQTRRESLDLTNTTLEYTLRDRADIRLWCDVADVLPERFYRAVERRLLLKGRCSIELHHLLEEFRQGRDRNGPTRKDLLARHELRPFSIN